MKFEVWFTDDVSDPIVIDAMSAKVLESGVLQLFGVDEELEGTRSASLTLVATFAPGHWGMCVNPKHQIDGAVAESAAPEDDDPFTY